jgi:alpha-mannosidase
LSSTTDGEDGQGWIVRLYEAGKMGTRVNLTFARKVRRVSETNLMEEQPEKLRVQGGSRVELYLRPFEIKTLKVAI